MGNSTGMTVIYPTGWGRFALNSPDGPVLNPGRSLTALIAGHQVTGTIQASDLGDYLRAEDGTTCGLGDGCTWDEMPVAMSQPVQEEEVQACRASI